MPLACRWPECGLQVALAGLRPVCARRLAGGSGRARAGETDFEAICDTVSVRQVADVAILLADRLLDRLDRVGGRRQPPRIPAREHRQVVQLVTRRKYRIPAPPALAPGHDHALGWSVKILMNMKTAYELAMERLGKTSPTVKLTNEQKKEIAELESKYAAKLAERELFLKGEIVKAIDKGDAEAVDQLEKQLLSDRKSLRADFEEKKEKVRNSAK